MKKTGSLWSAPVVVEDIPDSGRHIALNATPAIRAEVAELAAVREIRSSRPSSI